MAKEQVKERYVLTIPLVDNQRETSILDQRLQTRGKLLNATLGTALGQVESMYRDPRYRAAQGFIAKERSQRLGALRREYGLTMNVARTVAFKHWQASGWMTRVFGARIALAVGAEVHVQVKNWMLGHTRRPGYRPSADTSVIWGNDNKGSLVLRDAQIVFSSATKRKSLRLALAREWREGTRKWDLHLQDKRVVRVGIKREQVRGRDRYFALVCIEGAPYRNPQYLARVRAGTVGLDVGPSLLAVVGEDESYKLDRAPRELLVQRKLAAVVERRRQRAIDRSRRAMNPQAYDAQGRAIRGKRPDKKSRRQERLEARSRQRARTARVNRQADAVQVARAVMRLGTTVVSESNSYRSWQASHYGKRMGFTAPGALMSRIAREAEFAGGGVIEIPTSAQCAPSQYCLCGVKEKKPLGQRTHACPACGLGLGVDLADGNDNGRPSVNKSNEPRLDRDLFSALLVRLCGVTGVTDLREGPFKRMDGVRSKAEHLCAAAVAAPSANRQHRSIGVGGASNPANGLVAAQPVTQTPGQHIDRAYSGRSRTPRKALTYSPRRSTEPGSTTVPAAIAVPGQQVDSPSPSNLGGSVAVRQTEALVGVATDHQHPQLTKPRKTRATPRSKTSE
jgi:transposase